MAELSSIQCCECGIEFAFAAKTAEVWRESGKTFFCPNGHSLSWKKAAPELVQLRAKLKELETKLKEATEENVRLKAELEIWKPRGDAA